MSHDVRMTSRSRRGFTMTELLVAMFLATVGMIAVFGMQVAGQVVQRQARDQNAARMIGESFVTDLRAESINWTAPGGYSFDCTLTRMPLCYHALVGPYAGGAGSGEGNWVPAPNVTATASPTYNNLGINATEPIVTDLNADRIQDRNQRYCVHYKLEPTAEGRAPGEMLLASVRVYYPIADDAFAPWPAGVSDCGWANPERMEVRTTGDDDPLSLSDPNAPTYQFRYIELTTHLFRHDDFI